MEKKVTYHSMFLRNFLVQYNAGLWAFNISASLNAPVVSLCVM